MNDSAILGRCGFCDQWGLYVRSSGVAGESGSGQLLANTAERGGRWVLMPDGRYSRNRDARAWGSKLHRCKRADVKAYDERVPKLGLYGRKGAP